MHSWDCPIKISVVSAHSPFFFRLFEHENVGEPGRVPNFSDKIGFEELVYLLFDWFVSFFSSLPLLL